jgi:hypothetical protein
MIDPKSDCIFLQSPIRNCPDVIEVNGIRVTDPSDRTDVTRRIGEITVDERYIFKGQWVTGFRKDGDVLLRIRCLEKDWAKRPCDIYFFWWNGSDQFRHRSASDILNKVREFASQWSRENGQPLVVSEDAAEEVDAALKKKGGLEKASEVLEHWLRHFGEVLARLLRIIAQKLAEIFRQPPPKP